MAREGKAPKIFGKVNKRGVSHGSPYLHNHYRVRLVLSSLFAAAPFISGFSMLHRWPDI